jgi:hypothetical protein
MIPPLSIWLARVYYEDMTSFKNRPVLILDTTRRGILCLKMTSKPPGRESDYQLMRWKGAGLEKPTVVNTNRRLILGENDIVKHIGMLHADDIALLRVKFSVNV